MQLVSGPSQPATLSSINRLPKHERRDIYSRVIPMELLELLSLNPYMVDSDGNDLLTLRCNEGGTDTELELRHIFDFQDPILYGHITDTFSGQLHILLYVINDPKSPRFDIDRLPDGTRTNLGADYRNIDAELAALQAGLAPGQIRKGLHMLSSASHTFEVFVQELGHKLYFAEPLYYHNAIIFEQLGFTYSKGRKLMDRIQTRFNHGGDLHHLLDFANPFRKPEAISSIRQRSWAIHDGILGEHFTNVTMYKKVGVHAGVRTCTDCKW